MVPGWRTGWLIIISDLCKKEIKQGLNNLCSMIGHSNTIVQKVIPEVVKVNQNFSQEKFK